MRIGDLARDAGVTPKAVRYYESLGLVVPERLENGYRDYSGQDVRVVCEIRRLIELGIPAVRTRPFLDCLADHGAIDDCPSSLAEYRDAIGDLERRIRELIVRRDALARRLKQAACRRPDPAASEDSKVSDPDPNPDPHRETAGDPNPQEPFVDNYYTLPSGLPVPQDDGAADHLPGMPVPELALPSTANEDIGLAALGKDRTILYLYPLTGRPEEDIPEGWNSIPGARGCTTEACDFRDHYEELLEAGAARVFGLSSQDTAYQQEVVDRLRLPFAMLSDTAFRLAGALSLPTFDFRGEALYKRITLVVRDGAVEHAFYPVFPPDRHAGQVLAWLKENPL
ncbi:redoxin family protein [Catenulispora sp. NF23]|uniref:MerR family transcriptional regulator n=1 Tax=Catenulispora pinistramenti TaxID=2705254 RepID=UPI001BAC54A8|nr:MerR family transcriptional regulator [Catenulispora pinistramenti]MBS2537897.1 redoxin family protein [Catenulispora pinistramenti]